MENETTFRNSTAPDDIGLWYVGVALNMMASLFVTVGMMLQKLVHNRLAAEGKQDDVNYYTEPLWVFGLVLLVSEVIIDLTTFGLAPVSILAPLSSVTLVWNVLLAPIILKETLALLQVVSTFFILLGAILAVAFATQSTPTYEIEDVEGFLTSPLFIVFELAMVAILLNLHFSLQIKNHESRNMRAQRRAAEDAGQPYDEDEDEDFTDKLLESSCFKYLCGCYTKGLVRLTLWFFGPTIFGEFGLAVAYAFMTASLSGQTVGGAKLVIELGKTTFLGGITRFYLEPLWYVILGFTAFSVLLMLKYLNDMLARFDALIAVPIYQAFLVIMQLGTAAFLFDEFREFTLLQAIFFPVGTLICIFGIYLLSLSQRQEAAKPNIPAERKPSYVVPVIGVVGPGTHEPLRLSLDRRSIERRRRRRSHTQVAPDV